MKQALADYDINLDDIPILCDNKGAIDLSNNLVLHSHTKHIEIQHHLFRDNVQKGNISIEKVSSEDNIADILTKPLKRESFNLLRLCLGLMNLMPNGISPSKVLLTLKSTLPPLISPPSAPTQPSKHSSPLAINLDLIELLFFTPPTSSQTLFDTLEDLPPTTTNTLPLRPSFEFIERLANEPPPIPAMEPPPPMPPQLPTFSPNPPSKFPPLLPLGPNNPFPLLTHEMFCEH
nr:retrovirus-related Pol polyprotein from transposon TNT 1-94 [Tanacetum cinerariifolium]